MKGQLARVRGAAAAATSAVSDGQKPDEAFQRLFPSLCQSRQLPVVKAVLDGLHRQYGCDDPLVELEKRIVANVGVHLCATLDAGQFAKASEMDAIFRQHVAILRSVKAPKAQERGLSSYSVADLMSELVVRGVSDAIEENPSDVFSRVETEE